MHDPVRPAVSPLSVLALLLALGAAALLANRHLPLVRNRLVREGAGLIRPDVRVRYASVRGF
jgi:hypothetical protein